MTAPFVHLHVHSEYSLSTSLLRVDDLVKESKRMNMPACALTDACNLYGALYLWKAAKEYGEGTVKPIYGAELNVELEGAGSPRHLVLLAQDYGGYERLRDLVTRSHTDYGYRDGMLQPRIPLSEILKDTKGLIALTGGLRGVLTSFLLQDQESLARKTLSQLKAAFGEKNLFVELQDSSLSFQSRANRSLSELAQAEGLGVLATCDVHYKSREDALAQEIWMMVAQKLSLEQNPRSPLVPTDFFLKSPEEMAESFHDQPEALANTITVAARCNVKLSFKDDQGRRIYHLPTFDSKGETQEVAFARLCAEGLAHRMKEVQDRTPELDAKYEERLAYEVGVIQKMGFSGYYLIVSDFIRWAKRSGIPVGPGRGSGAGSLAAWALDIIDLDPIEFGLLFERFLNPERVSLPDFDVDFCQEKRADVIRYVSDKYGQDRVCQIVTFAKEQSKNAIKDVGRVMGLSFGDLNRLTKLVPVIQGKPHTIRQAIEEVAEMRQIVDADPKMKQAIDIALRIEGALRQPGVHAAGVIIAGQPVGNLAPLSRDVNGNLITQWDMKMSEEAGLVKFDFLGLVTLDLMDLACKLIHEGVATEPTEQTQSITYANIPIHDKRAYDLMSKGDTLGVFQLESSGMQNLCTRIKPDRFEDICAINALFRPGPLESGMVDDFINRKHGRAEIRVMFPEMEPILRETYGVILYQEQVQQIARDVAGYTLGGADLLRRAMGKKNAKEMDAQRANFVDGSVKQGKPGAAAAELFDLVEKFAGYGFNKSHAAAYAKLAVQTAYLKAVHPTEFYTALLTIEKEDTDKLARYTNDARAAGQKILPPDINESSVNFTIVKVGVIRFGLSAIKNVGEGAVEAILEARKDGPFTDLFDFLTRVDLKRMNKRTLECLIQGGAFDQFGGQDTDFVRHRSIYLNSLESALDWATKEAEKKASGQFSLFGGDIFNGGGSATTSSGFKPTLVANGKLHGSRELLDLEKSLIGIYLTGSPLDKYHDRIRKLGAQEIFNLAELAPKTKITLGVLVSSLREVKIKRGRRVGESMGILRLEDRTGQIELVSFPDHYAHYQELLKSDKPLVIRAELDFEDDKPKLIGGDILFEGKPAIEDLTEIREDWPTKIALELVLDKVERGFSLDVFYRELANTLQRYPGPVPVELYIQKNGSFKTKLELGARFGVIPEKTLLGELAGLVNIPGALRVTA